MLSGAHLTLAPLVVEQGARPRRRHPRRRRRHRPRPRRRQAARCRRRRRAHARRHRRRGRRHDAPRARPTEAYNRRCKTPAHERARDRIAARDRPGLRRRAAVSLGRDRAASHAPARPRRQPDRRRAVPVLGAGGVRRGPGASRDRPRHVHRARPPRRGDRLVHVHRQHDGAPGGVHGTRAGARRLRPAGRDHRWLRPADGPGQDRRRRAADHRALAVGLGNAALHDGRRRCARRRRRRRAGGAPRRTARCVRVLRPVRRRVHRHLARRRPAGNRLVRLRGQRRVRARRPVGRHGQPRPAHRRRRCTASRSTACSRPASRARRSGSPIGPSRSSRPSPP